MKQFYDTIHIVLFLFKNGYSPMYNQDELVEANYSALSIIMLSKVFNWDQNYSVRIRLIIVDNWSDPNKIAHITIAYIGQNNYG